MKTILIVEDDQLVATAYKKRFEEAGYQVEWAPDGLEAIKMVGVVKPDVVLLDLLMPRLDGIEVLKYIRSHADLKQLPVVVFSNSYMTNLVENAWRAGADQCLMKASTTPAQLFDVVNKAIQKAATRVAFGGASAPTSPPAARPPSTPLLPPQMQVLTAPRVSGPPVPVVPAVTPLARPSVPHPVPSVTPLAQVSSAPSAAAASPKAGPGSSPDVDPEFQAQIRQLFVSSAPAKLAAVREAANAFIQDQGSSMQIPLLADLFRHVHSLTGNAAVAGCSTIAHYASTFEALLQELQTKPKFINISSTRSIAQAVEFLHLLFQHALSPAPSPPPAPAQVMVVESDAVASQAITLALETAGYQAIVSADPAHALVQLSTHPCAAVIVSATLPGMSGFELCPQIQALPAYGRMPLLFVTALNDFQAHSIPEVLGENDLIAQPFLLIELTLKAVTHVVWGRLAKGA